MPSQGMYKGKTEIINNVKDLHIWLIDPNHSTAEPAAAVASHLRALLPLHPHVWPGGLARWNWTRAFCGLWHSARSSDIPGKGTALVAVFTVGDIGIFSKFYPTKIPKVGMYWIQLIQRMFTEHLLYARLCPGYLECIETDKNLFSFGAYFKNE